MGAAVGVPEADGENRTHKKCDAKQAYMHSHISNKLRILNDCAIFLSSFERTEIQGEKLIVFALVLFFV